MYDLIATEYEDSAVKAAIGNLMKGKSRILPNPDRNYRSIFANGEIYQEGDGGSNRSLAIVFVRGTSEPIDDENWWKDYKQEFSRHNINWQGYKTVIFLSCCMEKEEENPRHFGHANIASIVKSDLKNATIWASTKVVKIDTHEGEWTKIE